MMTDTGIQAAPRALPQRQIVLVLLLGITGILAIGFSPLILTELHEEGRLPLAFIGFGFTAELLGVGLGTTLPRLAFGSRAGPSRVALVLLLLAAVNLGSIYAIGAMQLALRFAAGLLGGLLVGLVINAIVVSSTPTRLSAWFLTTHTAAQLVVALAIAELFAPRFGSAGGFGALVVLALATLLVVPFLKPMTLFEQSDTARNTDGSVAGSGTVWIALVAVFLTMAGLVCIVSYSEIHVLALGFPAGLAQLTIPIVLVGQIVGGTAALVLSNSLPHRPAIVSSLTIFLGALLLLNHATAPAVVLPLYALIGFCWMFLGPFFVGWLLHLDPGRGTAQLFPAAQLLGIALGPLISGLTEGSVLHASGFSAAAALAALAAFFLAGRVTGGR